jgi:hypothetical protein
MATWNSWGRSALPPIQPPSTQPLSVQLIGATILNSVEKVRKSLERGAHPDGPATKRTGEPLMKAIHYADDNVENIFTEHDRLLGLEPRTRRRALDIMKLLLEAGANPNGISESTLNRAQTIPALRLLVQYGADVNRPDSQGKTPLIATIQYMNDLRKIKFLVQEAHADVTPDAFIEAFLWASRKSNGFRGMGYESYWDGFVKNTGLFLLTYMDIRPNDESIDQWFETIRGRINEELQRGSFGMQSLESNDGVGNQVLDDVKERLKQRVSTAQALRGRRVEGETQRQYIPHDVAKDIVKKYIGKGLRTRKLKSKRRRQTKKVL